MRTIISPSWKHTAFELPVRARPASGPQSNTYAELQQLKNRLLRPILERTEEPELCNRLRLAANEALAEASRRPFPFLLLPCFLEEKVREAQHWFRRQTQIRNATKSLFRDWELSVKSDSTFVGLVQA